MKLLTATLAAAFLAAAAGSVYAGEGGGCAFGTKKQTTAETLLPPTDTNTAGS